jgi:REP element-mobilizing transposase RayT
MMARQRELVFRTWGGRRRGAGRPPRAAKAGMSHLARPLLPSRFPVHVTWRMRPDVYNLRTRRCLRLLAPAFLAATRDDFRVVHYAVMGNHIHLLVEAHDRRALSIGMQGLGVRVARALNREMRRRGHVVDERFHAHILRTPTEVKRARLYLLHNARKHYGLRGDDWCASQTPVQPPHTYLLRLTC